LLWYNLTLIYIDLDSLEISLSIFFDPPCPPLDYVFDFSNLRDFLFTKLHNAHITFKSISPYNKSYTNPRANYLKKIGKDIISNKVNKHGKKKNKNIQLSNVVHIIILNGEFTESDSFRQTISPYLVVDFGKVTRLTSVIRDSFNPKWNNVLIFKWKQEKSAKDLHMSLMSYVPDEEHISLGTCLISFDEFIKETEKAKKFEVISSNETKEKLGFISVKFEFRHEFYLDQ